MDANPQWDIRRALGMARLFHLVCGVREACVTPFLTLYLRQLGLTAPWVGILMGTKHLIAAFWAPFCAFLAKSYEKRRALLVGSLLGSVGASLLMVLVPPLDKDLVYRCHGKEIATTTVRPSAGALAGNVTLAHGPASKHPTSVSTELVEASGFSKGPGDQEPFGRLPGYFVISVDEGRNRTQVLLHPITAGMKDAPWQGVSKLVSTTLPLLAGDPALESPANLSVALGNTQALDPSMEGLPSTFVLSLASIVFWELLTAPVEQVADDGLYEYLDFVDATDHYRSLWIWRLLGMSAGVCAIVVVVGQLDCLLMTSSPPGVVHFYGYSLLSALAVLVGIAFPIPISKQWEPSHKTVKALSLLRGDPHLILLALTIILLGVATSTVQNFLFWHMEDHGSSELIMGFSVALGLLEEVLLHPLRAPLLRKLSRVGMLGLGLGCLAGQLLYYSFLWSWWCVLPVQILSAISNSALWWAAEVYVEDLATPGTERPLGALFRTHFFGSGCSLGSFVGGFVVMRFGLPVLYQACCMFLLLWLALLLAIQRRLPQERKINYSKLLAMEASDTSDSEQSTERDWLVKAMREEHSDWKG